MPRRHVRALSPASRTAASRATHVALVTAISLLVTRIPVAVPRADAQSITRLTGRVVDHATHAGIRGATVSIPDLGRTTTSDSTGRYVIGGFTAGRIRFVVRALPFVAVERLLIFDVGEHREVDFELDSAVAAQTLPAVPVTAAAEPFDYRLVDFQRRRRTGRGQYLTDDEIKAMGAATLEDATRNMRGVTVHCDGGTEGCRIQMLRAPMRCPPEYIVDGHVDNQFGPGTPIRDVVGLEVYTGPADVPGEFAGANAGCGVIVVWTRSGPAARKK